MQSIPLKSTLDTALADEIAQLRSRFPDTQQLYNEVCVLLFFRHGITPTANRLYQLVRKGSMSAPAEALARFWENLREKSRVRISHPDLPAELADSAGELLGTLWQRARTAAQASFDHALQDAHAQIDNARQQAATELARAEAAAHALFQLQAEFSTNLTHLQELEKRLAREQGACANLEKQLTSAVTQRRELQEALAAARREYATQLEQERAAQQAAEEQRAALLHTVQAEAARERSQAEAARAALDEAQRREVALAQRHAGEAESLRQQVAQLRQELGAASGALAESRVAREILRRQIERAPAPTREGSLRRKGRIIGR